MFDRLDRCTVFKRLGNGRKFGSIEVFDFGCSTQLSHGDGVGGLPLGRIKICRRTTGHAE